MTGKTARAGKTGKTAKAGKSGKVRFGAQSAAREEKSRTELGEWMRSRAELFYITRQSLWTTYVSKDDTPLLSAP